MISPVASQFIRPRAAPYRPHLYTHNVYPSRARMRETIFLTGWPGTQLPIRSHKANLPAVYPPGKGFAFSPVAG